MIVVSNTSPIVNLAVVGQLDMLRRLYGKVFIPQAVYDEIVVVGAGRAGAPEVKTAGWIEARQARDRVLFTSLQLELDEGESEAIALAAELDADLLLLDERKARAIASRLGLRFIGLLGILIEAKRAGLVPSVKPIMNELVHRAGFWIREDLYARVLQAAGE